MADDALEKLATLKQMFEQGLINEQEFQNFRKPLLEDLGYTDSEAGASADPFADGAGGYRPRRVTRLADLAPGLEIGPADNRFELVKEIGGGGMGRVWLARDLEEENLQGGESYKALKVIHPALQDSTRALESLKLEALLASKLVHSNIINVYGYRQGQDGWPFVVMDHLAGRDLDRLLQQEGKPGLGWARPLELLRPIAAALDYAHGERLLHRDLKPGNVFITDRGEVKLLDFGLAYRLHRSSSLVKPPEPESGGTVEYMPPEAHVAGNADDASRDIYALACLTYEMLTGEPPYSPEASVNRSPKLLPSPPGALTAAGWNVLKRGLAYDKKDRPGSAGEFVAALAAAQTEKRSSSFGRSVVVSTLLVVGIAVGGIYYLWPKPETDEQAWLRATEVASPDAYEVYLARCPDCAHEQEAEQAIQQFENIARQAEEQRKREEDDAAYADARETNTVEAYTAYLARCPDCAHEQEAKQAVQQLEAIAEAKSKREKDDAAFESAQGVNTKDAYQEYLANCEICAHQMQAQAVLDRLAEAAREQGKKQEIADLKSRFEQHLKTKALTTGPRGHALGVLKQLERLSPDDPFIAEGRRRIALAYAELAQRDLDRGRFEKAKAWLETGESVQPGLQELAAVAKELEDLARKPKIPEPAMVRIPAGEFMMGSPAGEVDRDDDERQRRVKIAAFAIGKYEVTFAEYDRFADSTGREKPSDNGWGRGNRPVINVSWHDAVAYAEWLSEQTGKRYRLPTEAQWEYAARAGTATAYSFGDDVSRLGDYAWFWGNSGGKTQPVGGKKPNAWGLYDVHGNVREWVQDWYGEYSGDPVEDPQGPAAGSRRVLRGGSWFLVAGGCRSAFRVYGRPGLRGSLLGFRLSGLL